MIYSRNYNDKVSNYFSKNRQHQFDGLFSLLSKSIQQGNEYYALYAAIQISYISILKKQLLIIICENYPNIEFIHSVLGAKTIDKIYEYIIILCRLPKTRIVINALRIVSIESFKPSYLKEDISFENIKFLHPLNNHTYLFTTNDSINSINSINNNTDSINEISSNDNVINNNDSNNNDDDNIDSLVKEILITNQLTYTPLFTGKQTTDNIYNLISKEDEKVLIQNAFTIYKIICKYGISSTMKNIYASASKFNKEYGRILNSLYKYIDKRYLHVIFVYLALTSLTFSTSMDHHHILSSNIDLNIYMKSIPDYVEIPNIVFDLTTNTPSYPEYKYYFDNLCLNPSINRTLIDKFGESKFVQLSKPLDQSITEYIPTKEIKNIKLARLAEATEHANFALCSINKHHLKYKYIIDINPIKNRTKARNVLIADYIKTKLNLKSLNKRIILHNEKYYIIQDKYQSIIDESLIRKNRLNQTIYNEIDHTFSLSMFNRYEDDEIMTLKILKYILYFRMIGFTSIRKFSLIIYENEIYSLNDSADLIYPKTFFIPQCNKESCDYALSMVKRYWKKIKSYIRQFYKIISVDNVIPINTRLILLYQLSQLTKQSNWIFYDERVNYYSIYSIENNFRLKYIPFQI